MAFGTDPTPDGLANPPIDDLMKHADSKYALAFFAFSSILVIMPLYIQTDLEQSCIPFPKKQDRKSVV